jgi:ATP-dependent protease ClpP protease subunit
MTRRNRWTNLAAPQIREPIRAQVQTGVGEICIYDVIDSWGGEWGVCAAEVAAALASLAGASTVDVRLNSPGGDYFEGVNIAHQLARYSGIVTVHVDGLAASAASVVAMGGARIIMAHGSQMMIHEASSMAWGTAAEMRRTADMLDQTNADIAAMYAQRTGGDVDEWRAAVAAETWYTAAQAVAAGLADEVVSLPTRAPDQVAATVLRSILPDELRGAAADLVRDNPAMAAAIAAIYAPETPAPPPDAPPPAALPTAGLDLAELIRTAVGPAVHRDRTPA